MAGSARADLRKEETIGGGSVQPSGMMENDEMKMEGKCPRGRPRLRRTLSEGR